MANNKYAPQAKYRKANYVRFGMDIRPAFLEEFKEIAKAKGIAPTTEIKRLMAEYIEANKKQD